MDKLPADILRVIISMVAGLDIEIALALRRVCRKWRDASGSIPISVVSKTQRWNMVYLPRIFPNIIEFSLTKLQPDAFFFLKDVTHLTSLTKMQLNLVTEEKSPLHHFPRLQSLALTFFTAASCAVLRSLTSLTALEALDLNGPPFLAGQLSLVTSLASTLRSLSLSVPGCLSMKEILELPKLSLLRILAVPIKDGTQLWPLEEMPSIETLTLVRYGLDSQGRCFRSLAELSQLKTLCLLTDSMEALNYSAMRKHLLGRMTRLQKLKFNQFPSNADDAEHLSAFSCVEQIVVPSALRLSCPLRDQIETLGVHFESNSSKVDVSALCLLTSVRSLTLVFTASPAYLFPTAELSSLRNVQQFAVLSPHHIETDNTPFLRTWTGLRTLKLHGFNCRRAIESLPSSCTQLSSLKLVGVLGVDDALLTKVLRNCTRLSRVRIYSHSRDVSGECFMGVRPHMMLQSVELTSPHISRDTLKAIANLNWVKTLKVKHLIDVVFPIPMHVLSGTLTDLDVSSCDRDALRAICRNNRLNWLRIRNLANPAPSPAEIFVWLSRLRCLRRCKITCLDRRFCCEAVSQLMAADFTELSIEFTIALPNSELPASEQRKLVTEYSREKNALMNNSVYVVPLPQARPSRLRTPALVGSAAVALVAVSAVALYYWVSKKSSSSAESPAPRASMDSALPVVVIVRRP